MPAYDYKCFKCNEISEYVTSISDRLVRPKCKHCGCEDTLRIFSSPMIGDRVKNSSRVYYQWKGDPNTCPPNIRELLNKQDKPRKLSEFHREEEPSLGTGQSFSPKK